MYFYIVRHYFLDITWLFESFIFFTHKNKTHQQYYSSKQWEKLLKYWTGHIHLILCMPEELRYIILIKNNLKFSAAILAAIYENMQLLLLFLHIWFLCSLFHMNRHFIRFYIWKQSWDTLESDFRQPSWPPSWKICNCCYCFLHIWFLRLLFHMNWHFIRRYIWKQSWDTLDPEFRRPSWPPSWIF